MTTIKLRPWTMDDLQSLVKYANDYSIARYMTDMFPHPYTLADGERFIHMVSQASPTNVFAIEVAGEAVGSIGIFPQADIMRKNAEMGYWLAAPFRGKGIVLQAIQEMVEHGFKTYDITRIYARPYGSNNASQRVLEKAGFTLEARIARNIIKYGEWEDELIYAVRRNTPNP